MARIFLSSTFRDLEAFREKARRALQKDRHEIESMEDFPAGDERPVEECCRRVAECDLYACILAHRYGHRPIDARFGGKSVTELEYWAAADHNLDCIFFLVDEDVEWKPKHIDDGDSKALLNAFKSHVLANHSVAGFHNPDDLAVEISAAVRAWERRQDVAREMTRNFAPDGTTRFRIVSDDPDSRRSVTRVAAQSLWSEISRRAQNEQPELHIGIVGGPTTRQIIDVLASLIGRKHVKLPVLRFVALNSGGEPRSYQNSANYQVTRLAEALAGTHLVSLSNRLAADHALYESAIADLDVVLCSCGERDGFIVEWLKKRIGKTTVPVQSMLEDIVGDFCLTPIDATGHAAELTDDVAGHVRELQPRPVFRHIRDICRKQRTIIFPVVSHPRTFTADTQAHGRPTYKSDAVRAVLRSNAIDLCVLSEPMARALLVNEPPMNWHVKPLTQLCGFRLIRDIGTDALGGLFLARGSDDRELVLRVVQSSTRPSKSTDIRDPDIEVIVSDPPCESDLDDRNVRLFPLYIGGQLRWLSLAPRVRKPGFWAATAVRVAAAQLPVQPPQEGFRILDLGCGSGVIGAFIAANTRVGQLVFSDVSKTAVRCACKNARRLKISQVQGRVGDMFESVSAGEQFDLIVFGAPFFPRVAGIHMGVTDVGGERGSELAERFVSEVRPLLADRAHAITYLADYVDPSPVIRAAAQAGLQYSLSEKFILYPFEPKFGFPQCHEILYRHELEQVTGHRFREELWADRRFLCFKMVYFVLSIG